MIYFGIDPGKSGSISAIWDDGQPFGTSARGDWTEADISDWLGGFDLQNAKAVIERVGAMPKQGVSSTFKFGVSYGFLRGLVVAHKIPFKDVTPQKWQKAMECLSGGDKNRTKAKAQQLFPNMKVTHRNADSLLLAEYCRLHWK